MIIDFDGISPHADFNLEPCRTMCYSDGCMGCAAAECPHDEPLHRHHDGCPSCHGSGEEAPWTLPDLHTSHWRDSEE